MQSFFTLRSARFRLASGLYFLCFSVVSCVFLAGPPEFEPDPRGVAAGPSRTYTTVRKFTRGAVWVSGGLPKAKFLRIGRKAGEAAKKGSLGGDLVHTPQGGATAPRQNNLWLLTQGAGCNRKGEVRAEIRTLSEFWPIQVSRMGPGQYPDRRAGPLAMPGAEATLRTRSIRARFNSKFSLNTLSGRPAGGRAGRRRPIQRRQA
jgi:hypothetical protein